MKSVMIGLGLVIAFSATALASMPDGDDGLVRVKSAHDVSMTANKLVGLLESKGMTVFNRVKHSESAKKVDVVLRPTELVIFGNPKVGSPLMACSQSVAIDLPQKALVMEDEKGEVWLLYNSPRYLASRHHIEGCDEVLSKVEGALANFAKGATQ
ncbi:DUF302 domain-containing protein [Vibrio variabilis]|uniref:DUF302 domain-containing protein n=1 Tax=Vibrio variabilis TaxID=990271 RepID=UPI000DDB5C04|nr:DUF302 domain-containing protein [Vibrio variabilis]